MALPNASRLSTEKQLDLNIVYIDSKIYNPGTGRDDKVRTRREGSPSLIFVIRTSPTPWVFPAGYRKARGEKDFGTSRDVGAFDYQGGQRRQEQPLWRRRYAAFRYPRRGKARRGHPKVQRHPVPAFHGR